ncbi:MAG: hypothetical protein WCT77_02950 [Bacteroidota bacterium]
MTNEEKAREAWNKSTPEERKLFLTNNEYSAYIEFSLKKWKLLPKELKLMIQSKYKPMLL